MAENHDSKVQVWKKEVETNEAACKLIKEIMLKQLHQIKKDEMELIRTVDMEGGSLKEYQFYNEEVLDYCMSIIKPIQKQLNECQVTEDVLTEAIHVLQEKKVPYYK